jgi:hypothetical protein
MKEAPAPQFRKIFQESRALERDADVGEAMYKDSALQHVEFNFYDAPGVFVHNPSIVQQFLRRAIQAMIDLERNLVVTRLVGRRNKAREVACQRVKAAKRQGGIELGMLTQKSQLKAMIKDRGNGVFGWRTLQSHINNIMGIEIESTENSAAFCERLRALLRVQLRRGLLRVRGTNRRV